MAFDGFTVAAITKELNEKLLGGRLYKIAQPEDDELYITIKNSGTQFRLMLSANASVPVVYLTEDNKPSPLTAPNFCMLLRKHVSNGRIVAITQPDLERVIRFEIEHLDEMGDLCRKYLIIELMGKHSNIIFCDSDDMIIDSIKHVPAYVSSVREVLPGRHYFIPNTTDKISAVSATFDDFKNVITSKHCEIYKAIYSSFTGISPVIANEICFKASIDSDVNVSEISDVEYLHLYGIFNQTVSDVTSGVISPCIVYEGNIPVEFSSVPLTIYEADKKYAIKHYESISETLCRFYGEKSRIVRIRQHSADLRQIVTTALERNNKKYDLQLRQLKDTEKRDKYRIYGELINTYGYNVEEGASKLKAFNYYTNEEITIPLDPTLSARENAVHYFDKYNKLKRTFEALTTLTVETKKEIEHLESILSSLDIAVSYDDLVAIKRELIEFGYIKHKNVKEKNVKISSKPFHYISSDGFHMYVGKNNYQNEELTFKIATGNDWWFHAKNIPGSHVIVKCENNELPDNTFEEAARLAAYYSKARSQDKADVDYIQKKHIKKPAASKPGFVIYHTNYTMTIDNNPSKMGQLISD